MDPDGPAPDEFRTTLRAMSEFIPPRSTILDIGGGPGRYSIELAKAGHRVTLLDLSSRNVELARQKAKESRVQIADFVHGNALDLSRFADSAFHVVLLMGPLYHLVEPSDRDLAIREALRVLVPGGLFFASFITRYSVYIDLLKHDPGEITRCAKRYEVTEVVHIPTEENLGFTGCLLHTSHGDRTADVRTACHAQTCCCGRSDRVVEAARTRYRKKPLRNG